MNRDVQSDELSAESGELASVANAELLHRNSWETLKDSTDIFVKSLILGRVRGLVCITEFPASDSKEYPAYLQLTQELINRDILVAIGSAENDYIQKAAMMGPDFFKHTGDGLAELCDFIGIQPVLHPGVTLEHADILEFYNEVAELAAVDTPDLPAAAVSSLSPQQPVSPGTTFTLGESPEKTADLIDTYVHEKRVDAQWCDRCGGRFSPFS